VEQGLCTDEPSAATLQDLAGAPSSNARPEPYVTMLQKDSSFHNPSAVPLMVEYYNINSYHAFMHEWYAAGTDHHTSL